MKDISASKEQTSNQLLRDILIASANLNGLDLFKLDRTVKRYGEKLRIVDENIYHKLGAQDRATFLLWFLKRWGDIQLVEQSKLDSYDQVVKRAKESPFEEVIVAGRNYRKVSYLNQGFDLDIVQYPWVLGIHDFFYNQYEHGPVSIEKGDVIIDAGAFIGDTAVLFNHKADNDCELHCFELLEENLALLRENAKLNQIPDRRLYVNKIALSNKSGEMMEVEEGTLQGATKLGKATSDGGHTSIKTITIDDYVANHDLTKLDFIKMDIEGAELNALKGAQETIKKYKPKLAICLYHLPSDPVLIPKLVNEISPDYQFFFKWAHLRTGWEAVLLAYPCTYEQNANLLEIDDTNDAKLELAMLNALDQFSQKYSQADSLWKKKINLSRIGSQIKRFAKSVRRYFSR